MRKPIDYSDGLKTKVQLLNITSYPLHMHKNDLQILYVLEGEIDLQLTYMHYHLREGNIHIIHSEDVHAIKSITKDNLVILISINTTFYSNFFPNLDNIVFTANTLDSNANNRLLEKLTDSIFSVIAEQYNALVGTELRMKEKTISLLTVLTNCFRGFAINTDKTFEHRTAYDLMQINRISNIVCYVYENYSYKLTLSDIADQENLSLYYLSHLFQRFISISFRDFISMVRVEMSEYELLSTDHSISTIAQNVGFSNPSYYIKNFSYWFGMHPKEFRKEFSKNLYGDINPVFEEKQLNYLKDTILKYTSLPFCNTKANVFKVVDINIDQLSSKTTLKTVELNSVLLKKINQNFRGVMFSSSYIHHHPISSLYYNGSEQKICIDLLKDIITSGIAKTANIALIDTEENINGIFTINGMKKPMYYVLSLLDSVGNNIVDLGSEYFITADRNQYHIVVFNESNSSNLKIDFNFLKNSDNYKITERKIVSSRSCISYWFQLNFTDHLSEEEIKDIESMSIPTVSFHMSTPADHHYYTCLLEPYDMAFINIKKLNL